MIILFFVDQDYLKTIKNCLKVSEKIGSVTQIFTQILKILAELKLFFFKSRSYLDHLLLFGDFVCCYKDRNKIFRFRDICCFHAKHFLTSLFLFFFMASNVCNYFSAVVKLFFLMTQCYIFDSKGFVC